jgi:hypothetical protein
MLQYKGLMNQELARGLARCREVAHQCSGSRSPKSRTLPPSTRSTFRPPPRRSVNIIDCGPQEGSCNGCIGICHV